MRSHHANTDSCLYKAIKLSPFALWTYERTGSMRDFATAKHGTPGVQHANAVYSVTPHIFDSKEAAKLTCCCMACMSSPPAFRGRLALHQLLLLHAAEEAMNIDP
eukprot:4212387-Amphidinium_carterae.2